MGKFKEQHKGWVDVTVPAGTYDGQANDVTCLASYQSVYVKDAMPEEMAYKIAETICTNYDTMSKTHALMAAYGDEIVATGTGVEFHPGAQKYYEEHNIPVRP